MQRDAAEREAMRHGQLDERAVLQTSITAMKEKHLRETNQQRAVLGHWLSMAMRDKEIQRDMRLKQEEQQKIVRDETQRRIDAQKAPSLDPAFLKSLTGKAPHQIADQVKAQFKAAHERELSGYGTGLAVSYNKAIDEQISKAQEAQEQQKQRDFQKPSDRSPETGKDAFKKAHDREGGEKDWRSLMEDRKKDQKNEPQR